MAAPPLPAGAAALAAGPSAHSTQCVREFERLQTKATSKFERLRQLAPSDTCDVTRQFSKAFSAFLELWVYQQRHRATLVTEGGLTRPDIGEIASRIGHLHYLWYASAGHVYRHTAVHANAARHSHGSKVSSMAHVAYSWSWHAH